MALTARDVTYTDTLNVGHAAMSVNEAVVLDAAAPRARPLTIRDLRMTCDDAPVAATGPGRLSLAANLPGDGTISARGTGELLPPRTDATIELRGLDLALAAMWLPPGAPIVPIGGKVGGRLELRYAQASGLAVGGRSWIEGLALAGPDSTSSGFVRDDGVEISASGITVDDAGTALGHLELVASPTVVPGAGAAPIDVSSLRITADGGGVPAQEASRIDARITLPYGGRIAGNGEGRFDASRASFTVAADGLDVRLADAYLPGDAALAIRQGRLDARLTAAWTGVLDVDGRLAVRRLSVMRKGQDPPLVEHAKLEADVTDLRVGGDSLSIDRVVVTGAPVIVDGSTSPPQRFEIQDLRLVAHGVTWPGRQPIQLAGHAETAEGGRATLPRDPPSGHARDRRPARVRQRRARTGQRLPRGHRARRDRERTRAGRRPRPLCARRRRPRRR